MQLKGCSSLSSRIVLRAWMSLWMLIVPLVHIHPEADHHHGASDHLHGGTVHTVFSTDLTCEFSVYDHALVADESGCPLHLIAQPSHGLVHQEIDFVLAVSAEPQIGKGTASEIAAHSFRVSPPAKPQAVWRPQPQPSPRIILLTTSLSSRAPPLS